MSADNIVQLSPDTIKFTPVDEAIREIHNGGFVVMTDDEGRENDGVLICAAAGIASDMVNFMMREARGTISVAMNREHAQDLELYGDDNETISVNAVPEFGVGRGFSASERATTIQRLASSNASSGDFIRNGHTYVRSSKTGGVLRYVGVNEAATDMVRLAGFAPMGVVCEVLNDDGNIARRDELAAFARKHNLPFVSAAQLIEYVLERERFVLRKMEVALPTRYGDFTAIGYQDVITGVEHLALIKGDLEEMKAKGSAPLVRVHHEASIVDLLGENDAANVRSMEAAMQMVNENGSGIVVYLRGGRAGAGNGMLASLRAYGRKMSSKTVQASPKELRDYGIGAQILSDLGITRFRPITSNARRMIGLRGYGLEIVEVVPFTGESSEDFAPRAILAEKTQVESKVEPKAEVKAEQPQTQQPVAAAVPNPAPANSDVPEKKAMTMKMGAQIISGQKLFDA
jgi:3,4-dihydroxy 2-butanone 4-phosphate synthase/GTP cyclohydrolase II